MADAGTLVAFAVIGLLLDLLRKAKERQKRERRPMPPRPLPRARTLPAPGPAPTPRREWGRQSNKTGPLGRRPDRALDAAEDVEDRTSLEQEPEVRSLEVMREREAREVVDLDDESRQAAARRMREALARNRPHSQADHRAFDERLRRAPAKSLTAADRASLARQRLRDAVKWREILDRPVGWRDE